MSIFAHYPAFVFFDFGCKKAKKERVQSDFVQGVHSGAPAAEGRHAEPHTYRTHAFIFSWSSTSAAYGSRVRTYKRRSRRKMAAYGGHLAPSLLPPCTIIIYLLSGKFRKEESGAPPLGLAKSIYLISLREIAPPLSTITVRLAQTP